MQRIRSRGWALPQKGKRPKDISLFMDSPWAREVAALIAGWLEDEES